MNSTTTLMNEHRVIEQVLDVLEEIAHRSGKSGKLDKDSAEKALDFFRNFADGCHHSKEEDHLFPMLENRGLPRDGGPTGVMLEEHELGRNCVRAMSEEIDAASRGDAGAVTRFNQHALDFIDLLRLHISKEDNCLFPMAEKTLTEADQRALEEAFSTVAHEGQCLHSHEKYLRLADELAQRYGIATVTGETVASKPSAL